MIEEVWILPESEHADLYFVNVYTKDEAGHLQRDTFAELLTLKEAHAVEQCLNAIRDRIVILM